MDSKEYQKGVERTRNKYCSVEDEVKNYCLGMSSEVGKLIGHIDPLKDIWKGLDEVIIVEEMGDIFWYITALASTLKIDIDEVLKYNLIKLQKRYPDGFDPFKSIKRNRRKSDKV